MLYKPNEQGDRRGGCYRARVYPLDSITNADMDGIAVAVANVVVSFCLRILITWSPTHIDVGIHACLFQIYSILLSTLFSINRQQLSLFDASFALAVSSSPLMIYLVFASIGDLFGIKTRLYKQIQHRHPIRILLILVLLIWIGLSMTLTLSNKAFKDSKLCDGSTFRDWLRDLRLFFLSYFSPDSTGPLFWGIYALCGLLFIIFLFRRRSLVITEVRFYWRGASKPWGRLRLPWVLIKSAWCTIKKNHAWCIYLLFFCLDCLWALQVILSAIGASGGEYVLSYGQLVSVFATIPPLVPTLQVLCSLRDRHKACRSHFARLIWAEVKYIVLGVEPDPPAGQDNCLPFAHRPSLSAPERGAIPPIRVDEEKDARSSSRLDSSAIQKASPTEGAIAVSPDSPGHP